VFEAGHRIRLDLAGADWPNVWPPPGPVTLSVERSASTLRLPIMGGPEETASRPSFTSPREEQGSEGSVPLSLETREGVRGSGGMALDPVWKIEHDYLGRETRVVIAHGSDSVLEEGGLSVERYEGELGVSTVDPGRAWALGHAAFTLTWPEVTAGADVRTELRSDASTWHLRIELVVTEDGQPRWERTWERRFPRHLG